MVLDKTGTITKGKPELTDIILTNSMNGNSHQLLRLVASVEKVSEHPLAQAIVDGAQSRKIELTEVREFEAIPGHGVSAKVEGRSVLIGNLKLMNREKIALGQLEEKSKSLADDGKTPMFVAVDGKVAGIVAVADTVKEDSAEAIKALQGLGIEVVMITGDNQKTADAIAKQVGVDIVLAEVLPEGKSNEVKKLQMVDGQSSMVNGQ